MSHARVQVALIEEKQSTKQPIKNAVKTIENAQTLLLSKLISLKKNPQDAILLALDHDLRAHLRSNQLFSSLENINKAFNSLNDKLTQKFPIDKISEPDKMLHKGISFILDMYKIICIDTFLNKPVNLLISDNQEDVNAEVDLTKKTALLFQKIEIFNKKLIEKEEQNEKYILDVNEVDILLTLDRLVDQEADLKDMPKKSKVLKEFNHDYHALCEEIVLLTEQAEQAISEYSKNAEDDKTKRLNLCGSTLDVLYLSAFADDDKYRDIADAYKKLFIHSKEHKVIVLMKTIDLMKRPLDELEEKLKDFSSKIWSYQTKVKAVNSILTQLITKFKATSSILDVRKEHLEMHKFLKTENPEIATKTEALFKKNAVNFIQNFKDPHTIAKLGREADKNQKADVNLFIANTRLKFGVNNVRPVTLLVKREEVLTHAWEKVLAIIFDQEMTRIEDEFNRIQASASSSSLSQLKQLELHLKTRRDQVALSILSDKITLDRSKELSYLLDSFFWKAKEHNLWKKVKGAIVKLERMTGEYEVKASDRMIAMPSPNPLTPQSQSQPVVTQHSIKKMTNSPAVRAFFYGLLAVSLILLALTVWGIIAELAISTVFAAIGGAAGAGMILGGGFVMTAGGYYLSKCACVPAEPDTDPAPKPHEPSTTVLDDGCCIGLPIESYRQVNQPKGQTGRSPLDFLRQDHESKYSDHRVSTNPFVTGAIPLKKIHNEKSKTSKNPFNEPNLPQKKRSFGWAKPARNSFSDPNRDDASQPIGIRFMLP